MQGRSQLVRLAAASYKGELRRIDSGAARCESISRRDARCHPLARSFMQRRWRREEAAISALIGFYGRFASWHLAAR